MNIASYLLRSARHFPDSPAMTIGTTRLHDYATLGRRALSLAAGLSRDLKPGGTVAIASPNCPEYVEILFACWSAGLAVAPMNAKLSAGEIAYMIADCGAAVAFVQEALAHELSALLPNCRYIVPGGSDYQRLLASDPQGLVERGPDDLAWIFYTSGTTGKPKGAMLGHGALHAMAIAYLADVDYLDQRDALLHLAATSHASGLFGLSFVAKAGNNILPESGGFDPDELAHLIDNFANLSFFVPPTVLRRIGRYDAIRAANLANVKTVLLGAAPVSEADIRNGHALFGPKIWNGYGQGETPCTISAMSKSMIEDALLSGDIDRLTSVGIARTATEIRIAADDGSALPTGEIGEVLVRGPTLMKGYLNLPEASAEALAGGWLHTGDMGCLDACGYLKLLDRKKDLIISGGMNIYAREIEDRLMEAEGVLETAAIGIPDPEWGESVVAFVIPREGAKLSAEALDQHCLSAMARFKRPKHYVFVDELPKNASGKVLKKELRQSPLLSKLGQGGN